MKNKILTIIVFAVLLLGGWTTTTEAIEDNWHLPALSEGMLPYNEDKTDLTVEQKIRIIAKEEGFKWPDYLVRLANCESKLGKYKENRRGNYPQDSVDRGVYMINDYWHAEVSDKQAHDLEWATRWTINRINQGYQHEWACDKIVKGNYNYLSKN